jgi:hypothetical protein
LNGWFDREFPECRPIISGSRKTISAAIIAATAPSELEAKIASGVHSVWFWFGFGLLSGSGNSALLCSTNPFGQLECQR